MLITTKNSQLSIERKIYVKFVEGFSGLFCISITWHYRNLNVKCLFWWYLMNSQPTSLVFALFLNSMKWAYQGVILSFNLGIGWAVTYPGHLGVWYTSLGTQILTPKNLFNLNYFLLENLKLYCSIIF